jgi:hypothetical protein
MEAKKLTFQEAWDSSTIFFVDEELEHEIDDKVSALMQVSLSPHISADKNKTVDDIISFVQEEHDGLFVILRDIGLSDEKFMRIISLLRKIGRIRGGFDSEWSIAQIKRRMAHDSHLLQLVCNLSLFNIKR